MGNAYYRRSSPLHRGIVAPVARPVVKHGGALYFTDGHHTLEEVVSWDEIAITVPKLVVSSRVPGRTTPPTTSASELYERVYDVRSRLLVPDRVHACGARGSARS